MPPGFSQPFITHINYCIYIQRHRHFQRTMQGVILPGMEDWGADCTISKLDQDILQRAVSDKPDVKQVQAILKKYPIGECNTMKFGLVRLLLKKKANPAILPLTEIIHHDDDFNDLQSGNSPLHSAAMFGYDKIAKVLIDKFGADAHLQTPLVSSVREGWSKLSLI